MGLDCSATCCVTDRCAPSLSDDVCSTHFSRPYLELYVGLGCIFGLIIGIPMFVKLMNCLVLHKFCMTFDEMSETYWGGYSICDCFSLLCPCFCFRRQRYERENERKAQAAKEAAEAERKSKLEAKLEEERQRRQEEIAVQTKHSCCQRCIRSSSCLSCCCFVLGCVGRNTVEVEEQPPSFEMDNPDFIEDDEEEEVIGNDNDKPEFSPSGNASFDNSSSFKRDPNSTVDKLNYSQKGQAQNEEVWGV
jgi:hypothetical protein